MQVVQSTVGEERIKGKERAPFCKHISGATEAGAAMAVEGFVATLQRAA